MMTNLPNSAVSAVIDGKSPANKAARIAELEKELKKVRESIEEQERLDKRYATVQRAFDKLKRELFKTLTPEERDAIDGAYIFLHSGSVDLVRNIPSATSKGEDLRLDKDLRTVEALKELDTLTK
jgi:hypothetical protein